jgi:hypothetical protein
MGISIRAYARLRGVSDMAVRKAITVGRITKEVDGTIDPAIANAQWSAQTDPSQQRPAETKPAPPKLSPSEQATPAPTAQPRPVQTESEPPLGVSGSATFVQARTANEVIKAQTNKVKLSRMKGDLIERKRAEDTVFILAREERDALQNWPARVCAEMAAELGVDPHLMHTILERGIRAFLTERGVTETRF